MTTARKSRGIPAKIPREVKFLATAREFRGNGDLNLNPNCKPYSVLKSQMNIVALLYGGLILLIKRNLRAKRNATRSRDNASASSKAVQMNELVEK